MLIKTRCLETRPPARPNAPLVALDLYPPQFAGIGKFYKLVLVVFRGIVGSGALNDAGRRQRTWSVGVLAFLLFKQDSETWS